MLALLVFAFCSLVGSAPAADAAATASFEAANKLYEEGKYVEARAAYDLMVQTNHASPALLFNLGNASFKSGQIGRAIAAFRAAGELAPRDPDVRANVQFARNVVEGPTLKSGRRQQWLGSLSLNEWTVLTALWFWLIFVCLGLAQWHPAWKPRLRLWSIMLAGLAAVCGVCLALSIHSRWGQRIAVVAIRDAVVRSGPFDGSQPAFTAHDGAELRVIDQKDDWFQVTDGGRNSGWLKRDALDVSRIGTP